MGMFVDVEEIRKDIESCKRGALISEEIPNLVVETPLETEDIVINGVKSLRPNKSTRHVIDFGTRYSGASNGGTVQHGLRLKVSGTSINNKNGISVYTKGETDNKTGKQIIEVDCVGETNKKEVEILAKYTANLLIDNEDTLKEIWEMNDSIKAKARINNEIIPAMHANDYHNDDYISDGYVLKFNYKNKK